MYKHFTGGGKGNTGRFMIFSRDFFDRRYRGFIPLDFFETSYALKAGKSAPRRETPPTPSCWDRAPLLLFALFSLLFKNMLLIQRCQAPTVALGV